MPDLFKELLLPAALRDKSLHNVVNPEGIGDGVHKPEDPRKWLLPNMGVWAPVTAIVDFEASNPTGDPEAFLALGLRNSLRRAYQTYPETKDMVMVSYSLGGLAGKMQVQTTGDAVWQEVFKSDAAKLWADLPSDSLVKQSLVFEANPRIKRTVFICTPHLGTSLASGLLGQLGGSIILLPAQVVRTAKSLASRMGQKGAFPPNSISGMSPKAPLLHALYPLPVQTPFHSIIGNRGMANIPLKDSSDGVVPYLEFSLSRGSLRAHCARPARHRLPEP